MVQPVMSSASRGVNRPDGREAAYEYICLLGASTSRHSCTHHDLPQLVSDLSKKHKGSLDVECYENEACNRHRVLERRFDILHTALTQMDGQQLDAGAVQIWDTLHYEEQEALLWSF